jgi:hypothetical protein
VKASAVKIAAEVVQAARNGSKDEMDPQRLYSRFVTRCLELGRDVDMDAKDFYAFAAEKVKTPRAATVQ